MNKFDKIPNAEKSNIIIKRGIDSVFKLIPELSLIGTQEQYLKYINEIFPQSEIKEVVWHAANEKFDKFNPSFIGKNTDSKIIEGYGQGFYFSPDEDVSQRWERPFKIPAVINFSLDEESKNNYNAKTYIVIENPNNIHILGTKDDQEAFKNFIKNS